MALITSGLRGVYAAGMPGGGHGHGDLVEPSAGAIEQVGPSPTLWEIPTGTPCGHSLWALPVGSPYGQPLRALPVGHTRWGTPGGAHPMGQSLWAIPMGNPYGQSLWAPAKPTTLWAVPMGAR